jgi:four helix bundle protein
MLSHHKLKVYGKSLALVASVSKYSGQWDKRHAVVDQLCRASESIVLNLAEGVRLRSSAQKQQFLDYAVGSALECAACLDIAVLKQFLTPELGALEKRSLSEVVRMLVGLRRSWAKSLLQDDSPAYGDWLSSEPRQWYFAHEPLEVYQASLNFMRWFNTLPAGAELTHRLYRQIDKAATSLLLNLAEGYGRRCEGDRFKFFETAESSAIKAVAYLDLCVAIAELGSEQRERGIDLLSRIVSMMRALSGLSSE